MADEFRKMLLDEPVIPIETHKIKPPSAPISLLNETIGDNPNSCRPFVNDKLNSRLTKTLPIGKWIVSHSASLNPGTNPKHILHAFDRIIVQGDGPWQLFDEDCNFIERGYLDGSDVLIDSVNKLFYFSDAAGMIEARNLSNGNRVFSASLLLGSSYKRSFIARKNEQMIVVSIEREIDQDAPPEERPKDSTIEVLKFNEPPNIDRDGILKSSQITADLVRETLWLVSASQGETLVVAAKNQICLFDFDLQIKTALNGEFTPFTLSLNDAGIIFMVLYDKGSSKLRAITTNGERVYSTELPPEMMNMSYPPIVTYNNRVFLIKGNDLIAFAENGHYLWQYRSRNQIAGAVVTADNQLLISDGEELGVFKANGVYRTLYKFKDETLQTPPALNDKGELIVATDKKLYCLAIDKNN